MLEIPESKTIGDQAASALTGKKIAKVAGPTSPHAFTWYHGDPKDYGKLLSGHTVESASGHGAFVDIFLDGGTCITINEGTNIRYCPAGEKHPEKHQLLVEFTDGSFLVFTVAMYGGICAYQGKFDNPYYIGSLAKMSPLDEKFDRALFGTMLGEAKKTLSAKAFLATEQRIPGLGNGVVQDILFNAGINPRRKISTLTGIEKDDLFHSLKVTLQAMADGGGRDTEKDLFGQKGGYKCLFSKNTYKEPCPHCGGAITKEAYLGGAVYYCLVCQRL